jgi:NAD(P)H-dependent flavin oxidoreductase YrpB (nitropropane dioxygenase family)
LETPFAFDVPAQMEVIELAAARARVIDVFWSEPDPALVERIHSDGALALWQVGSAHEALQAAGRRMAEALSAGAAAVRIGTRFEATAESDAHPDYVGALLAAGPLRLVTGHIDAMVLYAGTGVADIGEVLPAAEVVSRLVAQARLRSV